MSALPNQVVRERLTGIVAVPPDDPDVDLQRRLQRLIDAIRRERTAQERLRRRKEKLDERLEGLERRAEKAVKDAKASLPPGPSRRPAGRGESQPEAEALPVAERAAGGEDDCALPLQLPLHRVCLLSRETLSSFLVVGVLFSMILIGLVMLLRGPDRVERIARTAVEELPGVRTARAVAGAIRS